MSLQPPSFGCGDMFGTPTRCGQSVVSPAGDSSTGQQRVGKSPEYTRAIYYLAKLVLEEHARTGA